MDSAIKALIEILGIVDEQQEQPYFHVNESLARNHDCALTEIKDIAEDILQSIRKGMREAGIKEI